MSSFYDDASLVVIPSGYKTSKIYAEKPTDGSGDLTFTRASNATRVASNGLIEKVRTNLCLQSNTFSTTWDNIGSSETSGQTGYDGTTNAWSLIEDSSTGNHLIRNFPSVTGLTTISVYAKAGTRNFLYLRGVQSSANVIGWFNLSTGALGTIQTNGTGKIESLGNGWYRCSLTIANFQSGFEIYVGLSSTDAVTSYAGNGTGNILIQNAQVETGDIATAYIPTTTAAVSVGPVSNVPRLDYLGSTCPRLLLEPQRTNLMPYSEQINTTNYSSSTQVNVTENALSSPDGYTNADLVIPNTTNGNHGIGRNISGLTSGATYMCSVFAKAQGYSKFLILAGAGTGSGSYEFNLATGTAAAGATITDYGNGWYRCAAPLVPNSGLLQFLTFISNGSAYSYAGNGTSGIAMYGVQVELGTYATSYIPTLSASVTRVGELVDKNGIASLIGGTSGTVFFEIKTNTTLTNANYKQFFYYKDSSTGQAYLYLSPTNNVRTSPTLGNITSSITLAANTVYKVAIAYANNDFKLYINGVERGSSTSGTPIDAVNILSIGSLLGTSEFNEMTFSKYLHFKSRLTNAQLAELTTL